MQGRLGCKRVQDARPGGREVDEAQERVDRVLDANCTAQLPCKRTELHLVQVEARFVNADVRIDNTARLAV
eukprot:3754478-Rhodomonas_salina.1